MPNIQVTMYLNDEDYTTKFLPNKKQILEKMRTIMKKELDIEEVITTKKQRGKK